jgi:hypothetical protein
MPWWRLRGGIAFFRRVCNRSYTDARRWPCFAFSGGGTGIGICPLKSAAEQIDPGACLLTRARKTPTMTPAEKGATEWH